MTQKKILIGAILIIFLGFILPYLLKQTKIQKPAKLEDAVLVDTIVEGISFKALPKELATAMADVAEGKVIGFEALESLQSLSSRADESSEILLALTWLQVEVVRSGVYIDDLRKDLEIGSSFYNRYIDEYGPNYSSSLLPVAEKLDAVEARVQRFEENPL